MAAVSKIKLKLPGINKVLQCAQPVVDGAGGRMASAAGAGISYIAKPHRWTARGFVQTTTREGRKREATDKVLTRSLSAGKG